jgi:segregation and condensation protein B
VSLAQDALDVLSLIAYRQPIPREEIDSVRGADSAVALRQLLKLGLVRMETNQAGRAYSTTPAFLEALGISTLRDLPRVEEAAG